MGSITKNVVVVVGLLAGCGHQAVAIVQPPAKTRALFCEARSRAVGPACVSRTWAEVHGVRRPVSRVTIDGREVWHELGEVDEAHFDRLIVIQATFFEGKDVLDWGSTCLWEGQRFSLDCEPLNPSD